MRRIQRPSLDYAEVYDTCANGFSSVDLVTRLAFARPAVLANFKEYDLRAGENRLFEFAASAWGNESQQVLGGIEKGEFVNLYSKQMANQRAAGQKYYDLLLMRAPLGKCPYCGFGQATTLDHFLSKARYPAFSVLCTNLVPSCTDCNKGKAASVVEEKMQIPHPYFELQSIEIDTWLGAKVVESTPATVRYFVSEPAIWPADLTRCVRTFFDDFKLARRFAIEAATEVSGLGALMDDLGSLEARQAHLERMARIECGIQKNSWKSALYQALSESKWFQFGGYRNPKK